MVNKQEKSLTVHFGQDKHEKDKNKTGHNQDRTNNKTKQNQRINPN